MFASLWTPGKEKLFLGERSTESPEKILMAAYRKSEEKYHLNKGTFVMFRSLNPLKFIARLSISSSAGLFRVQKGGDF